MKTTIISIVACLCRLSLNAQLPDTDIWILDLEGGDIAAVRSVQNITKRPGYDNQPCFSPDGSYLLYTSIRDDKQADIYKYDLAAGSTTRLTLTEESEYSPAFVPGNGAISVVRVEKDSAQRLWQCSLEGTDFSPVNKDIDSVGYYSWLDEYSFAAFILTQPPSLQLASTRNQATTLLASRIGRPIHKFYNKILFVQQADTVKWVCKTDLRGKKARLVPCIAGSEDFALWKNNTLLMAQGSKLYKFEIGNDKDWKQVAELKMLEFELKKITRIAVSPDNSKIAIVAE